jgi:GNAT superfamily N-acetyltransferase
MTEIRMSLNVHFHPTKAHLNQIKNWLIKENRETGKGFYCNWSVIKDCYEKDRLCCVTHQDEAIGFVAWWQSGIIAHLYIVEIQPDMRRKGVGKFLVEECFSYFRSLNISVVELECQPPTSEPMWRHLGFLDIPNYNSAYYNCKNVNLYRPLLTYIKENTKSEPNEVIELWDKEPYETDNVEPKWTWEVLRKEGTKELLQPIVHPCNKRWQLQWRRGSTIFISEEVKYFTEGSLEWGNYVVITELPAISNKHIKID